MSFSLASQRSPANLSCLQCQQCKRKCDKRRPCQTCIRRGFDCTAISRPRRPRGRHCAKSAATANSTLSRRDNSCYNSGNSSTVVSNNKNNDHTPDFQGGSQATPTHEVSGVCEILVGLRAESTDFATRSELPLETSNSFFLTASNSDDTTSSRQVTIPALPSKAATYAILDIYVHHIDPLLKVCHAPSLRLLLLGNAEKTPADAVLISAVHWAVTCILTPEECAEILGENKDHLLKIFRASTESLLARAQLNTTQSLVALQAFVVYLIGLRTIGGWRTVWTLLPVAIRIGHLHGLHRSVEGMSQFHTEIRRRLWCSISVLELQAGLDGGVFSTGTISAFLHDPPLHLDDTDISPLQSVDATAKTCFTDMTFPAMSYLVLGCMHKLIHVPRDTRGQPAVVQQWSDRYALVDECEQRLRRECLDLCRMSDNFQTFTETVGEDMLLTLRLLARRPLSRLLLSGPPPHDECDVLDLVITVIERRRQKFNRKEFEPWRWFAWTKWYALAILIAELCKDPGASLFDKAWKFAEMEYLGYMKSTPDSPIRTAIERLMSKARRHKASLPQLFPADVGTRIHTNAELDRIAPDWRVSSPVVENGDYSASHDSPNFLSWVDWDAFMVDIETLTQLEARDGSI